MQLGPKSFMDGWGVGRVDVCSRGYTNGVGSDTNNEASVSPNALKYSLFN